MRGRPPSSQSGSEDRRADPDYRRAFLDRHLEIAAHSHRQLGKAVSLAELSQRAEPDARGVGSFASGGIAMRPAPSREAWPRQPRGARRVRPVPRHPWNASRRRSPPPACPPRAAARPRLSSSFASSSRSSEWIRSKSSRASAPCSSGDARRGATGRADRSLAILPRASCTRFSPSAGTPASIAWRIRPTSTVLETRRGARPRRAGPRVPPPGRPVHARVRGWHECRSWAQG